MLRFVLRRLGSSLFAVAGVSLLVFLFLHIVPGDPVDNLAGGDATPEQRQEMVACMGLDLPLHLQLVRFAGHIADGSLGRQCPDPRRDKPPVITLVARVFPYTLELALGGVVVALVLALPLGILAAVRRGSTIDAAASLISLAGISIPVMWMGPALIFIFYVQLAWLPGPGEPDERLALLLPSVVIGTHLMAMLARMTRSSLLEVLREDFMQTARAKGLAPLTVIVKHGLRNALLPVITVVGLQFGSLLAGATITENVFARPGLGTLIFDAIKQRNYPVIQGCVLVVAVITVTVNLLVDLAYGAADPRNPAHMRHLSPGARLGAVLLAVFLLMALFGPLVAPYSPTRGDLDARLLGPSAAHWLGTDENGVDLLSELLHGARLALFISVVVVLISAAVGVTLGTVAGYFGGAVDEVIMRVVDILLACPGLLINLAIVAVIKRPGVGIVIFALSLTGWVTYARVARAQVLSLRERDYVSAARAVGAGAGRVMRRHIVPNLLSPLIVQMTFGFGGVILIEASLSFLGVGPQLNYSWGALLDQGRGQIWNTQRIAMVPGMAIAMVVIACNLLGDGLRDRLDPKRQR